MKKLLFLISMVICLLSVPMTGFAAPTEEEKSEYQAAVAESMKSMLTGSIALDKISAENKSSYLKWLDAENPPEEAKKLVDKLLALQTEQEKDQESLDPYTKAKKACDEKLNADGANAALENIIRIQKDRVSDQEELQKLWKKVDQLLK